MERRNHPRKRGTHPVFYSSYILHSKLRVASTLDLSMEGVGIETLYGLQKGQGLNIYIVIGQKVIKCRGHVVHIEWPVGDRLKARVKFEEVAKDDTRYLSEYISSANG